MTIDPEILELARSIKEHGLQDPPIISSDGYIISGHRRRIASYLAGLTEVPVQIYPISRQANPKEFVKVLVGMNSQRIKDASTLFHESLVKIDPKSAHQKIINERKEKDPGAKYKRSFGDRTKSQRNTMRNQPS